ncbi:hypothetical protein PC114_g25421 [Phytophthora cactorum]|uniref:Uncharacterized protein n=3 Tax=Phytophthora cactorum TaxID=29920 RepID=A0A8T1AGB9_9STRA|nr:hypothetical protein PC114_g25421 [Phytophthora cactorum]KAG2879955.1 hypothetical protein PC115_g22656 [Phytophthora cactorum]
MRLRLVRTLPTGTAVSVIQRYILRRFVEETKEVFLWKTYSEGEGSFAGLFLEETGWARIQASTESDATQLSVCVHQAPMQVSGSRSNTADIQEFRTVMRWFLEEEAQAIMGLLSKKLLEESPSSVNCCERRSVIDKPAFKRLTRQQKETLRKQRYLLRLKNERETLKRTEHELTSRLTQLQQETEIKKRRTVNNQVIRRSSWRDFALLQRGQLHHPKEEHKKLVSAVNIQSRYFKTLSELVPEPLLRSAIIKQITSMSVLSSLHTNNLTNRFEFAEQLRQTQDDGGPEYYQHFNMFTQPFHLNRTQQTWWKLASFDGMITDREDYADLADPDQAAILRLRLIRTLATGLTVSIIQRYIFHRIVGESRTIFTWKTLSEGEGIFSGMSLKENGWACLQESVEDESTVVGVCDQQVPRRFGDSSPHQKNSQEFCELMHNMLNDNARMITATLSELLIKETLADIDILV